MSPHWVAGRAAALLLAGCLVAPALADELTLPAATLDGEGEVVVVWHPDPPQSGTLSLVWTDSLGRRVDQRQVKVAATAPETPVPIDLRRSLVPQNHLVARFTPDDGAGVRDSAADFVVRPQGGWNAYQVLMWQDQTPAALATLPDLGVTGTAILRPLLQAGPQAVQHRLTAGLRFYTENLATDFYAAYHRYSPGRSVTWRFDDVRAVHRAAPDDLAAFARSPSLSDPAWLNTVTERLADFAWREAPYRPLFHNLADEAGIADLAAAWDFDLSPVSLAGMRTWLAGRYGDLQKLNLAWGTRFATWDDVRPALTGAAIQNEAAVPSWMDFKAWMDLVFAQAVRAGTDAVHRGDPNGLAGLEGAQVPGWGGYDYARLANSVDVMEIYDAGNAVEIARSLNPGLRVLTTMFEGAAAQRQLWHELLLGGHGVVLWDDQHDFVTSAGQPGPRGLALAPILREFSGAVGAQLLAAQPEPASVAILYSQASFRTQWLLDRRAAGTRWEDRDSASEFDIENAWRAANRRAAAAFSGLGVPTRWITPETLIAGHLDADGIRVLVLPDTLALSDPEIDAIRRFAAAGGLVLADTPPGQRDGLGRLRASLPLADLAAGGTVRSPRALSVEAGGLAEIADLVKRAGITRPVECFDPDRQPARDLDIRLLHDGPLHLVAIQSLTGERSVELRLSRTRPQWFWWFPGSGAYFELGKSEAAADPARHGAIVKLSASEPLVLALSDEEPSLILFDGPHTATQGDLVTYRLKQAKPTAALSAYVQIDITDPAGHLVPRLSQTVRVPPEGADWRLRLALNDLQGTWKLQFWDATLGDVVTATLDVQPHDK